LFYAPRFPRNTFHFLDSVEFINAAVGSLKGLKAGHKKAGAVAGF